jgi:hypothetical protein
MGSGSVEKAMIGERFRGLADGAGLRLDIDTSEAGRLYGESWYRFLGRCRAVLGVESGTSYLDLEDEVSRDYAARLADGRPVTLEALQQGPLGRWDHNFSYRTISPRHFEAAAFRICQVMFEGQYSGVLAPMVHYVPLKKDFSNFKEVVAIIADDQARGEIVENAHRDLIRSGAYSYDRFVAGVDDDLMARGLETTARPQERTLLDAAMRSGRFRRRLWIEAHYVTVAPRMFLARRVPRASKLLRVS